MLFLKTNINDIFFFLMSNTLFFFLLIQEFLKIHILPEF